MKEHTNMNITHQICSQQIYDSIFLSLLLTSPVAYSTKLSELAVLYQLPGRFSGGSPSNEEHPVPILDTGHVHKRHGQIPGRSPLAGLGVEEVGWLDGLAGPPELEGGAPANQKLVAGLGLHHPAAKSEPESRREIELLYMGAQLPQRCRAQF